MSRIHHFVLASTLILSAAAAHAETNLLTNGSFETPSIAGTSYVLYGQGSTAITGWTVVGDDTQLTRAEFLAASEGSQWIDLTGIYGYNKGLRSDAVATTVGQRYTLSFDIGDYYVPGFQTATIGVSINNGSQTLFTNIYEAGVMDWKRQTLSWVADSSSASITFLGAENGSLSNNAGIGLDNVVFTQAPAVPEPATYGMLLGGLAMVGALMRRKNGSKAV
ncbi:DUF642 domain-containing protein [Oxalobacteraceae bacterium]|nr:DUF642 domain-containing protein [Oxalobacteraceae bacterium]